MPEILILYKLDYLLYIIKKRYISGFDVRNSFLDIFKMSILWKRRNNLEKPWFLGVVTEMLSFMKKDEKCCDANFLCLFLRKIFRRFFIFLKI